MDDVEMEDESGFLDEEAELQKAIKESQKLTGGNIPSSYDTSHLGHHQTAS
jgi:hypothetical protein